MAPKPEASSVDPLLVRVVVPPLVVLSVLGGILPHRARKEPPPAGMPCGVERTVAAVLRELAAQDWLVIGYVVFLLFRVQTGTAVDPSAALVRLGADLLLFVTALFAVRGRFLARAVGRLVYRGALFVPILGSFLQLEYVLPLASGRPLDAALYSIDLRVFGFEPAEVMDAWVTRATTEWFAFFYYGYFFLIAVYVLSFMAFAGEAILRPFGMGFLWTYCAGQAAYTLVPAFGPYAHIASHFQHPLEGATFWPLVQAAVASVGGGARTDVFPSLHTAVPTFLAVFSFQHRDRGIFRRAWLVVGFAASQMIIATMYLRWHYLIDVVAGLALAASAFVVIRIGGWWDANRRAMGGQDVW